jgi:predicted amidohydrolase YtcJ
MAISSQLFKQLIQPKKYIESLEMLKNYWHSAGSTLVVEPGGLVNKNLSILQNHVFASDSNPFHMDYIVDGKTMALQHMEQLLEKTEEIQTWGEGMSRFMPKQIKLFSDGAVFSQLMQMYEGYTDGHHGEWIMQPDLFKEAFKRYWNAGYQIHVHQNGDAGLDMVLDTLEENMRLNPRKDHRTVIVHFSYTRAEQVSRLNDLGAIVSVNPYYPVALAEMYSDVGVGAERSHAMVRMGDLTKEGVNFSLHSDIPMAPGQPLFLMWCAVNRISLNGNVIAPEQSITAEQALRGVTINAAYSMHLEGTLGTLTMGKIANITILKDNPLTVNPVKIKDIEVVATIHEGRVLPVKKGLYREVTYWEMIPVYWNLIMSKL